MVPMLVFMLLLIFLTVAHAIIIHTNTHAYPHSSVVVCHIAAQLDDLCHLHWVLSILLGPLYCITKTKWQRNVVQQLIATAMTFGANAFSKIML